ncbi:MAG: ABC transporter permease [bacterium]|nr:ABC transporter permease [bacterium]
MQTPPPNRPPARFKPVMPAQAGVNVLAVSGLVFLTLPLIGLLIRGVGNIDGLNLIESGILQALGLSLYTTLITCLLIALIGTPLAYLLARRQFRFKRVVDVLIELPVVLPPAVAGLALLVTYGRRGLLGGALLVAGVSLPFTVNAVIMAQAFVAAPFFIRAAQIGFQAVPAEIEQAARVDGAAGWALFRHITLPLSFPALAAGLILSWARALGEFGATILFAGSLQGRTQTMPLFIYNVIERDLNAAVWAGLLLIALAMAALLISNALARRGAGAYAD